MKVANSHSTSRKYGTVVPAFPMFPLVLATNTLTAAVSSSARIGNGQTEPGGSAPEAAARVASEASALRGHAGLQDTAPALPSP